LPLFNAAMNQPQFTFTAAMANGDPLPTWLTFTPSSRSFSGTPPSIGKLYVTMTVSITFDPVNGVSEVD
jgi:lysozyme family protein